MDASSIKMNQSMGSAPIDSIKPNRKTTRRSVTINTGDMTSRMIKTPNSRRVCDDTTKLVLFSISSVGTEGFFVLEELPSARLDVSTSSAKGLAALPRFWTVLESTASGACFSQKISRRAVVMAQVEI